MRKMHKSLGFAVVIAAIMFNVLMITGCPGDLTNEPPPPPPPPPPPTATFAEIELFASSWGEEGEFRAEQWETNNQIKLASFSSSKPKQGDVLRFKISGVSDEELKYIRIELGECVGGDWSTYNYLGSSWTGNDDRELVNLSTSFTDILIDVPIDNPTNSNSNAAIYAQLVNLLWEKDSSGEYVFNSGETLPAGFQKGDVMATISNFKISLVSIDSSHNIENNYGWNVWRDNSSSATMTYSVAEDGVCTVTIGGTPEKQGQDNTWRAWTVSAEYFYTGTAGACYEYKFEAWTGSGTRNLHVQYYNNNTDQVYLGDDVQITATRTTYTVIGEAIPKGGKHPVQFQLADQLGTVNIKMLEVKEFVIGKLTITNIPAKSGLTDFRYTWGETDYDYGLSFGSKIRREEYDFDGDTEVFFVPDSIRIEGTTMIIPVWYVDRDEGTVIPFTGSKSVSANSLMIRISNFSPTDWIGDDDYYNKTPITFTNGNANINFSTQMVKVNDELTYTSWLANDGETDLDLWFSFNFDEDSIVRSCQIIAWEDGTGMLLGDGTYTISGSTVTLNLSMYDSGTVTDTVKTGTLSGGNTLTFSGWLTFTKQ